MKRTYLYPLMMRRGSPVLLYMEFKDNTFWLCVSHCLKPIKVRKGKHAINMYRGNPTDYQARHATAISEECYDAFVKDAKYNACRYKNI